MCFRMRFSVANNESYGVKTVERDFQLLENDQLVSTDLMHLPVVF